MAEIMTWDGRWTGRGGEERKNRGRTECDEVQEACHWFLRHKRCPVVLQDPCKEQ